MIIKTIEIHDSTAEISRIFLHSSRFGYVCSHEKKPFIWGSGLGVVGTMVTRDGQERL